MEDSRSEETRNGFQKEVIEKYETLQRNLKPTPSKICSLAAISLSFFQLYTAAFGNFPDLVQRGIHFMFAFSIAFVLYPPFKKYSQRDRVLWLDVVLIFFTFVGCGYVAYNYLWITLNPGDYLGPDIWIGAIMTILVLEGARRVIGPALPILGILAIMYAYFGPYLPGVWQHKGFSLRSILQILYLGPTGIWGVVTGISATLIAGFLIFGAILQTLGGGETFVKLALLIAGRSPGGPGKVSCFSSAFFGTISGSAVANVVVDGIFNIPLMKRVGFRREMAAAVEATTSSGGQLVPPVMGAGAFLMSEFIGVPYFKIAMAAILPAFMFYSGCWWGIHFEARRLGLKPAPPESIPTLKSLIPELPPLIIPAGILVYLLGIGYSPSYSVLYATVVAVFIYLVGTRSFSDFKKRLKTLLVALDAGGRSIVMVAVLCGCAQIVIGLFNATGFGIKLSEQIIGLSGQSLLPALFFAMVVCLVLGMGIPTTAAYVLAASVVAPALITLGVQPLTAHFFIFYFAVISAITPPVCSAVYVASAIAGIQWWRAAWIAMRLGLPGFIAPYMIYYSPSLLLKGTFVNIIINAFSVSVGIFSLAAGIMGYFLKKNSLLDALVLFAVAGLLIKPGLYTDIVGFSLLAIIFLRQRAGRDPRGTTELTEMGNARE